MTQADTENPVLDRIEALLFDRKRKRPWLAQEADLPISTVNGWWSNGRTPRTDELMRIAEALDVTVDFLLTGQVAEPVFPHAPAKQIYEFAVSLPEPDAREVVGMLRMAEAVRLQWAAKEHRERRGILENLQGKSTRGLTPPEDD